MKHALGRVLAFKPEASLRFLAPILAHFDKLGLGHVSEISNAEAPRTPRGCPWQAWSPGELLRLDQIVLADVKNARKQRPDGLQFVPS